MVNKISIEAENLSKRYNYTHALRNVTLKVLHGEIFGLLGPNGSGKTTFLKILATLTSLTSGDVKIYGMVPQKNGTEIRKIVGFSAHDPLLYNEFTGEENIQFYAQFYSLSSNTEFNERLDQILSLMKLSRRRYEPVKNLSSGLRKRFDFARAIIHDPMILLLDEPFSGLDMDSAQILQDFIRSLRGNKTVILSTHDVEKAKLLCDKVAILVEGKVCGVSDSQDITAESVMGVFKVGASK